MSQTASPCPDADPAATPGPVSERSQLAGIRELVRIAELQAQAYAREALTAEPEPAPSAAEASTVIGIA